MTPQDSTKWVIKAPMQIDYGLQKRGILAWLRKVRNTILNRIVYTCPNNRIRILCLRMRGCYVGRNVYIGRYCFFDNMYPEYIYIYDGASVNAQSMILTHFNPFESHKTLFIAEVKPTIVSQDALVSVRSTIMPGISIGQHAVVSAGSVVVSNVAPFTLVQGNPAKKVTDFKVLFE